MLAIPLPNGPGTLLLLQDAPLPGEPDEWAAVGRAFGVMLERHRHLRAVEEERDVLRQRAEESEALHVLGLAANRSLDPDEVLNLVSRFTRTLLGASYVTVSTGEGEATHTVASIGLYEQEPAPSDDPLAAEVVRLGKPVVVEDPDAPWSERFPFHAAQGMHTGLGVPLSLFGSTFGALVVGYRRSYPLTPRDTRLALTLAGHAAVAISNARLHHALADRSRELERAYGELRWTSQAKERFFATMSHELRTPLNAILGYQSLLLDGVAGEVPSAPRRFVENAQRATQALLLLVNDVLDLSKIEAGKLELDLRPASLHDLAEDAVATIGPMAAAKQIELRVATVPDLPKVRTDADRVRQILLNLLSNAVKFTDRGTVALETAHAAAPEEEPGAPAGSGVGWVVLRVTDTGPGIAPEDQERIFHEFEQVAGVTAREGTGLGLPISRKLARLLGGELLVESAPGYGSTFVLRLPLDGGATAE
jgi:signal transduction histidine kinase